jgi:tetratricopeptide (TPR) repeat protein
MAGLVLLVGGALAVQLFIGPGNGAALLREGRARAETGELDRACTLLAAAANARPRSRVIHYELAKMQEAAGRDADAMRTLETLFALYEDHADGRYLAARLTAQSDDAQRALELLGRALEAGMSDPGRIRREVALDPLRGEPAFVELLLTHLSPGAVAEGSR